MASTQILIIAVLLALAAWLLLRVMQQKTDSKRQGRQVYELDVSSRSLLARDETASHYHLQHLALNARVDTAWLNMGYWRDTTDFPTACEGDISDLSRGVLY